MIVDTAGSAGDATDAWTPAQILVVTLCFVINMIDGMDVLILSYVAPGLQADWAVGPARFGIVFSAGLGGMAIGGIVVAPLADRIGRKRMILAALLVMSGAMIASGFASGIGELVLSRIVVGTGIGTVLACMAALAADNSPPRHRNFAVGVLQAGYPVGATLTGFVVAAVLPAYGWSRVLIGAGMATLTFVPLLALLLPAARPLPRVLAAGRQSVRSCTARCGARRCCCGAGRSRGSWSSISSLAGSPSWQSKPASRRATRSSRRRCIISAR